MYPVWLMNDYTYTGWQIPEPFDWILPGMKAALRLLRRSIMNGPFCITTDSSSRILEST